MKITGYGSIDASTVIKKRGDVSQKGNFADLLAASETEESSAAQSASDVSATSAMTNMLALQEISEEEVQRRKLMQKGKGLVDVLEQLRQQLLIGTLPLHMLRDLNLQLAVHKQASTDPQLNELIEDIELRAAVELAKIEMAMKAEKPEPL